MTIPQTSSAVGSVFPDMRNLAARRASRHPELRPPERGSREKTIDFTLDGAFAGQA